MRPPRRDPPIRTPAAALLLAALAALTTSGCGDAPDPGGGERRVLEPREDPGPTVTAAAYRTVVSFAPHGPGPAVHLRLAQTARPGGLERRYDGWTVAAGRVRRVLAVRDTLPTPRAGWRPLPAPGLRIVTERDGRPGALLLRTGEGPLRLERDSTLREWPGPTGQRERLSLARAVRGGDTAAGLMVERRRARPLDAPAAAAGAGLLLVAGPGRTGAAVLLAADRPDPADGRDGPGRVAAAHVLSGGELRSRDAVRWTREETGAPLRLELDGWTLRVRPDSAAPPTGPVPVAGTLEAAGAGRPVRGLLLPREGD